MLSIADDVPKLQMLTCKSGQATRHLHIHRKRGKNNKRRERKVSYRLSRNVNNMLWLYEMQSVSYKAY